MPLDPLNDPLLRAPRSHAPTIAGMTEAANTATPEQLADFVDAIGASGGGGGGGHPPTDLGATATPTGVTATLQSPQRTTDATGGEVLGWGAPALGD